MKIIKSISALETIETGSVVTIGNFDGLHLGHQAILRSARQLADHKKAELLAITFDPHPAVILAPEKAPQILTPPQLKQRLLTEIGVDCWLILRTDAKMLALSAPDFIEQYVVEPIAPSALVEGEDFSFGAARSGNVKLLQRLGAVNDFEVTVISAKKIELNQTVRISSTMVRYMLQSGNVADATAALGRPYKLIGPVIPGRGKGKELGFPTLNMERPNQLIPAEGVYAGLVTLADDCEQVCAGNDKLPAVFSVGQARTFGEEHPLLIEAHMLDDISEPTAGKWMAMDFVRHVRRQHKFTGTDELSRQIAKDCAAAREILKDS